MTLARMIYYILKKENKPMTEQAIETALSNYITKMDM